MLIAPSSKSLEPVVAMTRSLSDRQRLRILMLLRGRELCACQMVAVLRLAPATIERHLALLEAVGLLSKRREKQWMVYRMEERTAGGCAVLKCITDALARDTSIRNDNEAINNVLRQPRDILCRKMCRRKAPAKPVRPRR